MNYKKYKNLIFLLTLSLIIVIGWVGFEIYHNSIMSTVNEDLQIQVTPIDPHFDTQVIKGLESRSHIEPAYSSSQSAVVIKPTLTPTPTITVQPTASRSASGL